MPLSVLARFFLARNFWIVKGAGVLVASGLAASAVTTLVGTQLAFDVKAAHAPELPETQSDPPAEPAIATVPRGVSPVVHEIVARNVFCPTCEDAPEVAAPVLAVSDVRLAAGVPLRLVATMQAERAADSLATIMAESGRVGVYSIGDAVMSGVRLHAVANGAVELRTESGRVRLAVGQAASPAAPARVAKSSAVPRPKVVASSASIPGANEAIRCSSAGRCRVEREFVESLMKNPAALATQASVRLAANGFQFMRVRRGTLPALLGLKSGDVLTEVNGDRIDSIDKAMALATKLRHASNLSVTLLRKGALVRTSIEIA